MLESILLLIQSQPLGTLFFLLAIIIGIWTYINREGLEPGDKYMLTIYRYRSLDINFYKKNYQYLRGPRN